MKILNIFKKNRAKAKQQPSETHKYVEVTCKSCGKVSEIPTYMKDIFSECSECKSEAENNYRESVLAALSSLETSIKGLHEKQTHSANNVKNVFINGDILPVFDSDGKRVYCTYFENPCPKVFAENIKKFLEENHGLTIIDVHFGQTTLSNGWPNPQAIITYDAPDKNVGGA